MQLSMLLFTVLFSIYALSIQAVPLHKRHTGEATYYNLVGTTSCGGLYTDKDFVVAISMKLMDDFTVSNPNNHPYCGKTLSIHGPKGSVEAKVVDSCPGCGRRDLDLSPNAFDEIGERVNGRAPITWTGL
ncbi:unnamed protein product [Cunninghamella blakesleeana]